MNSYGMCDVLNPYKKAKLIKLFNYKFSCFIPVHSFIFSAVGIDSSVIIKYVYLRKAMTFSDLIVVRVMGRGDFNNSGTKFSVNI